MSARRRSIAQRAAAPRSGKGAAPRSGKGAATRGGRGAASDAGERSAPRLAWWLAAATLALPPLFVLPYALEGFRLPQCQLSEWLALASLVPLAAAATVPRWRQLWRHAVLQATAPLLLLAAGGLLVTRHPAHVREALADLAIGVAALVGWSLGLPQPALRRLLDATLLPAAVLALLGILQLHHLWEPVIFAVAPGSARLGITSLAGNPGDLAAFLVLPCLVAQAGLAKGARGRARWWRAAVLAVAVYALAGTQTLTALAAALAGSVVLWAARLPRRRLLPLGAAAAVGALLLVLAVAPVRHRVVRGWWAVTHGELDAALSGRLDGWRVALELTQRHPLAGVGWGAYRAEFAGARLRLMAAGMPFFLGHVNPSFANAHNELLEVGADLGWPGLLALAWALALVGRAAWRARRRMSAADAGLCFGGLVAAALLALFYFPFRLAPVAFGWVAFLAWLLATGDGAEEATGRKRWPALALTALLVLALLGQGVRGWHRLQSSVLVRFVQQQGMALGSARPPGGLVRAELQVLRQAHRRAPATIEPLAFEGDLLLLAGRLDEAVAAYRRAVALEPRAEVFFNWGLALWSQGRVDEAVVQLRRGVALGPRFRGRVPPGAQPLVAVAPVRPL